jgi:hypothetical protein
MLRSKEVSRHLGGHPDAFHHISGENTYPRKSKVSGFFLAPPRRLPFRETPERNQPRLFRVQGQTEFGEPLRQNLQHLFRILPVLKTQDGVINVSDLVRFPFQPGLHRFLEPFRPRLGAGRYWPEAG